MVQIIDLTPNDGQVDVPVNTSIVLVTDEPIDQFNAEKNVYLVVEGTTLFSGSDTNLYDNYLDFYRLTRSDIHKSDIVRVKATVLNQVSGPNYISFFDPVVTLSKNKQYQVIAGSEGTDGALGLTSIAQSPIRTLQAIIQGILYEKVADTDNITLVYTDDGTAGSETVDVTGTPPDLTITVHMEDGVSTSDDIALAITNEVSVFGVSISAVTVLVSSLAQQEATQELEAQKIYIQKAYHGITDEVLVMEIVDEGGKQRIEWYLESDPTTKNRVKLGPAIEISDLTIGFTGAYEVGEKWRVELFIHTALAETVCNTFETGELDATSISKIDLTDLIESTLILPGTSPLAVASHTPIMKAVEVSSNQIEITFSVSLDPLTVLKENFSIIGEVALDFCGLFESAGAIDFDIAIKPGTDDKVVVLTIL